MQNTDDTSYAAYLSNINRMSKSVKAIIHEDLYNKQGALIAPKGVPVNPKVSAIIAKHKLLKPLDTAIFLENGLTQRSLQKHVIQYLEQTELTRIPKFHSLSKDAILACNSLGQYSILMQKLTVLKEQIPVKFDHSVLRAVLSLAISQELELSEARKEEVFIANILSNIGFVHMPHELAKKKETLTFVQRKKRRIHCTIAKNITDGIPHLPPIVSRALLEQNERADGFGDPFGKSHEQLCIDGQIIAVSSWLTILYFSFVKNGSHNWDGVLELVRIPTSAHTDKLSNAALRVLIGLRGDTWTKYTLSHPLQERERLQIKHKSLNEWFSISSQLLDLHHVELEESSDFKPKTLFNTLHHTIAMSGMLSQEQLDWLNSLDKHIGEADIYEMVQYDLKLKELEKQCFFIMYKMRGLTREMAKRFRSFELAKHYYIELMEILRQH